MTAVELKKSIHEKIEHINDVDTLEMWNKLIHDNDAVFVIPQEHLPGIKQGAKDIANGDFISLDDFEKRYEN